MKNKLNDKEEKKKEYEDRVLKKIYLNLNEKQNELEIINSEIYIIKKFNNENEENENLKEELERIQKLLERIEKIKLQIKIYKENKILKDNILLDDESIIQDISDYKKFIEDNKDFKNEYSKIESYIIILAELDKINEECIKLDKIKKEEIEKKAIEEKKLEEYKIKTIIEEKNIEILDEMTNKINITIKEFDEKVEKIEEQTKIIYNYDLLNEFFKLQLKYLMLMGLSPLKGLLPYIAISSKRIEDTIDILKEKELVKKEKKIEYFAEDYRSKMENSIDKIKDIKSMLSASSSSIIKIKEEIINEELAFNNPVYVEIIEKIDNINEIIKSNLEKVEIYEIKIKKNYNKNEKTLKKVLEMNEN